jgi:hypothetical protein
MVGLGEGLGQQGGVRHGERTTRPEGGASADGGQGGGGGLGAGEGRTYVSRQGRRALYSRSARQLASSGPMVASRERARLGDGGQTTDECGSGTWRGAELQASRGAGGPGKARPRAARGTVAEVARRGAAQARL